MDTTTTNADQPIKVGQFMGSLNRGGAEGLTLDVCNNAAKSALELVFVHRNGGPLMDAFCASGVEVVKLRPRFPFDTRYLASLRRLIKEEKLQILHTHQVLDAVYAILASTGLAAKVVLSLHGHGLTDDLLTRGLRKFAIGRGDKIIFVSQQLAAHYARAYGSISNGTVLHNGIDFGKIRQGKAGFLREELKLKDGSILLGAVGNFHAVRDQLTTCRFLALLAEESIPFHFVFVGAALASEPALYKDCVRYCEAHGLADRVTFLGSRSDVPALLPQLDAFVYSSAHDTFGIAVVEAIAAGIPVFVNDWEVMREVTNDGAWATLYKSKNEADLLAKFLDFYQNRESYREEALQNALAVNERYGINQYLINLKAIYRDLLNA